MALKLGVTVDLRMAYMPILILMTLDLDARSQWLGRGKKSAFNYLDNFASNRPISMLG